MGILTVKALSTHMFCATMSWKFSRRYDSKISGKIERTFEEAIESLDARLQEDADVEMVKRGAA